jgi:hypothetical protein
MINFSPKITRIAEQTLNTISWILLFHKCFDLNVATDTNRIQMKSQDQWTMANRRKPINPKALAVKIRVVPIVPHHKKK